MQYLCNTIRKNAEYPEHTLGSHISHMRPEVTDIRPSIWWQTSKILAAFKSVKIHCFPYQTKKTF